MKIMVKICLSGICGSLMCAVLLAGRAGADDRGCARYTKNAEDIVMKMDPLTKKQEIAARMPAEIKIWTLLESREVYDYTDSEGNTHYRTEYYTERHVGRSGVDKFQVLSGGRVNWR